MKSFVFFIQLSIILFFFSIKVVAQDVLAVEDISVPNEIYTSAANEAQVTIRCNRNIPLAFGSTMDKSATPFSTDTEGTDSIYRIEFPTGKRYRGRALNIYAHGYQHVTISLEDLQPKQSLTFVVYDPNSTVDAGCYRTHRNKGMEAFRKMEYAEARNQFDLASQCSDCAKEENQVLLANVDSIIVLRKKAEDALKLLDYNLAEYLYDQVYRMNPNDTYAQEKSLYCDQQIRRECGTILSQAESYFERHHWERALELYQRIVEMECNNSQVAIDRIGYINTLQEMKQDHAHVLTYQWQKDAPFGFHYGSYKRKKWGGFVHLAFSGSLFKLFRKGDAQIGEHPELDFNFGFTSPAIGGKKNPVPVHIFFGPGLTTKFYMGDYLSNHYPNADGFPNNPAEDLNPSGENGSYQNFEYTSKFIQNVMNPTELDREQHIKTNAVFAISPEIGVLIKYSYAAIRISYSYRFCINKGLQEFMGPHRLCLGVGVAF